VQGAWAAHHHITSLLNDALDLEPVGNEPVDFLKPQAFFSVEIEAEFFLECNSHPLDFFDFDSVPLRGVRAVVDVDRAHVEIFLMASCPAALHFQVKLGIRAAVDFLLEVGHHVRFSAPAEECLVELISQPLDEGTCGRLEVHPEENAAVLVFFAEHFLALGVVVINLLVLAVFADGHSVALVQKLGREKSMSHGMLDPDVYHFITVLVGHQLEVYVLEPPLFDDVFQHYHIFIEDFGLQFYIPEFRNAVFVVKLGYP
jgi:hypothetical protein